MGDRATGGGTLIVSSRIAHDSENAWLWGDHRKVDGKQAKRVRSPAAKKKKNNKVSRTVVPDFQRPSNVFTENSRSPGLHGATRPNPTAVLCLYRHAQLRRSPVVHSFGFVYSSVDLGRARGSCRPAAAAGPGPLSPRVIRRQEQRGGELPAPIAEFGGKKDRGVLFSPK
jgi:hypothetical protein